MRRRDMYDLNDPRQFDAAFRDLAPVAFASANRVLRDEALAEDVVQDVFVHLWRRPGAYDPARGSLPHYVAMLARSRATDRWRSRSAREAAVERSTSEVRARPDAQESAAEPVIRRERSRRGVRAPAGPPRGPRAGGGP